METIDIDSLDLDRNSASVDLNETCAFLSSMSLRAAGSASYDIVAGRLPEHFAVLGEACDRLGLGNIPLFVTAESLSDAPLRLRDFLTLLERSCRKGVYESANIDMLEDLAGLEHRPASEEDDFAGKMQSAPVKLDELVAAMESCGIFERVFVDPSDGLLLTVDYDTVDAVFAAMDDHGRKGMSEQTAAWIANKYVDPDDIEPDSLDAAVRVYCRELSDIGLPEDYEMLKLMERCVDRIEDVEAREKLHELALIPENVHRIVSAFTEAGLAEEGRQLYRAAIELYAMEWLEQHEITWE